VPNAKSDGALSPHHLKLSWRRDCRFVQVEGPQIKSQNLLASSFEADADTDGVTITRIF
jgi:hypothetical protein